MTQPDPQPDIRDELFMQIITDQHVDPRPLYKQMRDIAPVYKTPFGMWWTLGYDVTNEILTNKSVWSVDVATSGTENSVLPEGRYVFEAWQRGLVVKDGEDHSRLHSIVKEIFKPSAVRRMRTVIEETVASQLSELGDRSEFDLRWDFAEFLPTRIILDLLGIDQEHLELFSQVAESLSQVMEPDVTEDILDWGDGIWRSAAAVVEATADERRADPRDDLMTALVRAEADGERLTRDELVAMVLVITVAGQETTGQLICSGLYHLLNNPEQAAAVRADRSLIGRTIEECLRHDTPTRVGSPRYAVTDVDLGGVVIPAKEPVMPCYSAANCDPATFDRPFEFDITRPPSRHVGFGAGVHHCLGSALARLEIEVVWNQLLDAYEVIEVAPDLAWKPRFMVRGLESMPLTVESSRALAHA